LQPISKYDRSQESKENTELDVDTDPLQSFPSLDAEQLAMLIGLAKSDDHDIGGAQPAGPHAEELEPLVASIAQVVPDVQLDYLSALVKQTLVTDGPAEVAERIIAPLIMNPSYPKIGHLAGESREDRGEGSAGASDLGKGKGKRELNEGLGQDEDAPSKKPRNDYASVDSG
jgi:hypothetical protein